MERANIKCLTRLDIRGYHLLDDDGMPFVTIEALRRNLHEDPPEIDVYINLDRRKQERNPTAEDLQQIKPHVLAAVEDVRHHVGNLPLRVYKKLQNGRSEEFGNWLT